MTFGGKTRWPGRARRFWLRALGALTVASIASIAAPLVAVDEAQAQFCAPAITECSRAAASVGSDAASLIGACRAVRECRQECRSVRRETVGACRGDRRDCTADCRRRFGRGRDFRQCRRACRRERRGCVREARGDRRECRRVCRETFLTPECRQARFEIVGSSLSTIGACAAVASCVKGP